MTEVIGPSPREIKFGGKEKAESIKRGFAITTLRNPRDSYNFSQGEGILADCFESGEKVHIVVISNETKPLRDFAIPQLALDGYFSVGQALADMRAWPGYENTTSDSPMQAITFITEKSYSSLPKELQDDFYGSSFDKLVKVKELRHLFFPTMCLHLTEMGGKFPNWMEFLKDYFLITNEEKREMEGHHYLGGLTAARLLSLEPSILKHLSMRPDDKAFKPLILGIFD